MAINLYTGDLRILGSKPIEPEPETTMTPSAPIFEERETAMIITTELDPVLIELSELGEETILNYQIYKRYLNKAPVAEGTKTVYLTIDDGPNPKSTEMVLEVLKEKDVPATFFVLGTMIKQFPELLMTINEAGHGIGNHGYTHIYSRIYSSANEFLWEINETNDLIKEVSGVETRLIRAPGGTTGHFTTEYYQVIEKAGYIEQDWNVDTKDSSAKNVSAKDIMDAVRYQSQGKQEVVVLFHDSGKVGILEALPQMIDYYLENGYQFAVLPQDRAVATHQPLVLQEIGRQVRTVLAKQASNNPGE
jgi:peptidoglycan/xylan/chitin deacetylase (PgdA/CDA1 family)